MKKLVPFAAIAMAMLLSVVGSAAPLEGSITMGAFGVNINGTNLANSTLFEPISLITPGVFVGLTTGDYNVIPLATIGAGGTIDTTDINTFVVSFPGFGFFGASIGMILSQSAEFLDAYFEGNFVPDPTGGLNTFDVSPTSVRVSMNKSGASISFGSSLASPPIPPEEIPEPATFAMLGAGLVGLALLRRKAA